MKKTLALITSLFFCISFAFTAYAGENPVAREGNANADYAYVQKASANLEVNNGVATCEGYAKSFYASYKVKVNMYLQQEHSSGWSTIQSFSGQDTGEVTVLGTRSGLVMGHFRIYLSVYVYDTNDTLKEHITLYSDTVIIP